MNKTDIIDVTDKWEAKTRGGLDVIRVEKYGDGGECLCAFILGEFNDLYPYRHQESGQYLIRGNHNYDLIPKKPAPTPLERILPYVDHWWRDPKTGVIGKLSVVDPDPEEGGVKCDGVEYPIKKLIDNYLHAAAIPGKKIEEWNWESVP